MRAHIIPENGEFYVAGVRVERRDEDVYLLYGTQALVSNEKDYDYYVNGIPVGDATLHPRRGHHA